MTDNYFEILRSLDPSLRLREAIDIAEQQMSERRMEEAKNEGRTEERERILRDLGLYCNDWSSIDFVLRIASGGHRFADGGNA